MILDPRPYVDYLYDSEVTFGSNFVKSQEAWVKSKNAKNVVFQDYKYKKFHYTVIFQRAYRIAEALVAALGLGAKDDSYLFNPSPWMDPGPPVTLTDDHLASILRFV